jgi:hypothetical protein
METRQNGVVQPGRFTFQAAAAEDFYHGFTRMDTDEEEGGADLRLTIYDLRGF